MLVSALQPCVRVQAGPCISASKKRTEMAMMTKCGHMLSGKGSVNLQVRPTKASDGYEKVLRDSLKKNRHFKAKNDDERLREIKKVERSNKGNFPTSMRKRG
eukprot:867429-Pelagomonas_calceolata.AAC.1